MIDFLGLWSGRLCSPSPTGPEFLLVVRLPFIRTDGRRTSKLALHVLSSRRFHNTSGVLGRDPCCVEVTAVNHINMPGS